MINLDLCALAEGDGVDPLITINFYQTFEINYFMESFVSPDLGDGTSTTWIHLGINSTSCRATCMKVFNWLVVKGENISIWAQYSSRRTIKKKIVGVTKAAWLIRNDFLLNWLYVIQISMNLCYETFLSSWFRCWKLVMVTCIILPTIFGWVLVEY